MSEPPALTYVFGFDYARRTGGYVYNERLVAGLAARGWHIEDEYMPRGFPRPDNATRSSAAMSLRRIPDNRIVLIDQIYLGVLPSPAREQRNRLRLVMIVHHPLALERYGTAAESARLAASERIALSFVRAALVTSSTTAATLIRDYDVPADRIIIAPPGVEGAPLAHGSRGGTLNLLSVGAVVPRKDHGTMIAALAGLPDLPWRLTIVGNLNRAPDHVAALRTRIAASGLAARIRLAGELSDAALARLWARTDLYVASSAHEGYGMALSEAFARGIPVVTTAAGAAGAWVGRRGAVVVRGGQAAQFRAALRDVLAHPARLAALRDGAVARRRALRAWDETVAIVDHNLRSLPQTRS